jgi:branched-subunit amino acid aminotransferase/4-amino-4-deoxychorismate lyase
MSAMNQPIAFFNGQWISASAAAISLDDAGFVQGTAVAEQLRTFGGKLFRLREHLARLAYSLEIVSVEPGMTLDELAGIAEELAARNHALLPPGDDLGLSIVVTPGVYPTFAPPAQGDSPISVDTEIGTVPQPRPIVCLHTYRLPFHLWVKKYREGQRLVTTGVEQVSQRCWPPALKCRSRMHYYLADRQAAAIDPQARALLLDAQGFVVEASTANVLIYRGKGLLSPPLSKILHGISLSVVTELAGQLGIPFTERDLTIDDLSAADEVLLTSTSVCILPVTQLNGRPIGAGRPDRTFSELMRAWSALVGLDIIAQAELQAHAKVETRIRNTRDGTSHQGESLSPASEEATRQGLEHTANSSGNHGVALQGGAKSGALSGDSAPIDPDLAAVVAAWPTLPEATRQSIVAAVKVATADRPANGPRQGVGLPARPNG